MRVGVPRATPTGGRSRTRPRGFRTFAGVTDTSEAAALRALMGGKATPPDIRTLKAVHRGLVLLPDEAPTSWDGPADDAAPRRAG